MAKMNNCNFCGKSQKEVGPFVEGNGQVYICHACVRTCEEMIQKDLKKRQAKKNKVQLPSPRAVKEHLDRFIVGQEKAKKIMAVSVVNHYKRLIDNDDPLPGEFENVLVEKSNMLIVGPTGTGKTLIARAIAEFLGVPFAIGDATTLTEAGYVGEDVENLLLKLIRAAEFDIEAAQRGIIYIDEIDKLHKTGGNVSITRDVSGEGVQQSLLKMIEGTVSNVPPQGGRKHPEQQYVQIDTSNILFICGGSFVGLEEIISRRLGQGRMGFKGADKIDLKNNEDRSHLLTQVEQDDLIEFGLIPELVGRLPVVTSLQELTVEQLQQILTGKEGKPENAILKQVQKIAAYDKVSLKFTDDAVEEIAKTAKAKGTGARALRAVVEGFMNEILYVLPEHAGEEVLIDVAVVKGERLPFGDGEAEAA